MKKREEFEHDEECTLLPPTKICYNFKQFEDLLHEFDKSSLRTPDCIELILIFDQEMAFLD